MSMSIGSITQTGGQKVSGAAFLNQGESQGIDSPNKQDAQWFSASLEKNTKEAPPENVAERIVGQLAGASKELQALSDQANRALSKASKSSSPQDIMKASRSLSSFYLESMLTTKLISKGTQAVEKLTSLQ